VAHPGEDNAYDLYLLEDAVIRKETISCLRTGIAGYQPRHGFLVVGRGSTWAKGLLVVPSLIDEGYRGEWHVSVTACDTAVQVRAGDRIGQAVPLLTATCDVIEVNAQTFARFESVRGTRKLGSSGR
jgi:dUTPase